jgi:hypothetical protein
VKRNLRKFFEIDAKRGKRNESTGLMLPTALAAAEVAEAIVPQ